MSYRLVLDETIAEGIRRIATEQADEALKQLTDPAPDELDERIHNARKRFKKIRAILRLVRDEIGNDVYQRENVSYRDAGRAMSDLRDSAVYIETFDRIMQRYDDQLDSKAFAAIRSHLQARHERTRQHIIEAGTVGQVVTAVEEARDRIAGWPLEHDGFEALCGGLHRVYQRGYKAMQDAYDQPNPENFHEWRKRVKYLWYHLRILKNAWPDVLDEMAGAAHDLADWLGDDHDLAEFRRLLLDEQVSEDGDSRQVLVGLAEGWQRELQARALPLGKLIYAEKPDRFTGRIGRYWNATRPEISTA